MIRDVDIAWLAGVFDGEGCVYLQRSKRKGGRLVSSLMLIIGNTSTELVERVMDLLHELESSPQLVFEARFTKTPMHYVKVARKADALRVAKAILSHSTAKRSQLQMAIWYLERACKSRQHVATEQDLEVLAAIKAAKRGGEIPAWLRSHLNN